MSVGTICLLIFTAVPDAAPAETFSQLLHDAWENSLREDPLRATRVGDHRFNDRLPDESPAAQVRRQQARKKFQQRLAAIDRDQLPAADRVHYDVFRQQLEMGVAEHELNSHLMPITNRWGFHVGFAELYRTVPLKTVKDYENYLARLRGFERYTDQHIELMREGVKQGYTLPAVVLEGYREPIEAHIVADPAKSLLFEPFEKFPARFTASQKKRLSAEGRQAIAKSVVPGYQKFLSFMEKEYVPSCRGSIAAAALPQGREYYRHCVRRHTTLDLSPQQVHDTGLAEVKRITAEMEDVVKKAKFDGDRAAFVEFLRTDAQFYAETPEQLMKETALVLKKMDGQLPLLFKRMPRTPYGIRQVPDYIAPRTTTAYYEIPSGDGGKAGFYFVNTYNLKSRPLYQIEALSLHEAVPGHHLQLALQQEMTDLPIFRRHAHFTAYIEGWALYAERLGLEVGFYEDPYSDYGRLSYEMWRACRLVVDSGIHYFGWTRQQAIQYMEENTALSRHNITSEVDRYISWPGQALAYKIGELKIRQLRTLAEKELGERFDVRDFHDAVLRSGAVPLPVLEENVKAYVAAARQTTE